MMLNVNKPYFRGHYGSRKINSQLIQLLDQTESGLKHYSRLSLSRIPRDYLKHSIGTLTYPIFRKEEKIIRTTIFNKFICNWTLEFTDISKNIVEKRRNFSSFPQYFLLVKFSCLGRDKIFTSI